MPASWFSLQYLFLGCCINLLMVSLSLCPCKSILDSLRRFRETLEMQAGSIMLPIILMNVATKKSFTLTWVALITTIHTDTLPVWPCNAHSQTKPAHKVPSAWNVAHPTPHLCFLWANSRAYFKSRVNAYVKLEYNFHECPPCAWLCRKCLECSRPSLNTFWNNESIYQNILEKTEPKKQKK